MKKKRSKTGCFGGFLVLLILAIIIIVNSTDDNNSSKVTSETTSNSPSITIKYSKVSLNVRKRPNEKSKVLKVLKPNEKVTTKCEQKNGFTQILSSSNQNYGWCSTKYLQDSPLSESQLEEIELRKIEAIEKRANEIKKEFDLSEVDREDNKRKFKSEVFVFVDQNFKSHRFNMVSYHTFDFDNETVLIESHEQYGVKKYKFIMQSATRTGYVFRIQASSRDLPEINEISFNPNLPFLFYSGANETFTYGKLTKIY